MTLRIQNLNKNFPRSYREVMILKKEKMIFLLIPKNGTISLRNLNTPKENKHFGSSSAKEFNRLKGTRIAILRDPWDRFISAIRQVCHLDAKKYSRVIIEEILSEIEDKPEERTNVHLVPQSWFLKDREIDHYLRLESLSQDWKLVEEKFNLSSLLHKHRTPSPIKETISSIVKNEGFEDRVLNYLQPDYELIKSLPEEAFLESE